MEYLVKTGQDINSYTEKLKYGDVVMVEPGEYGNKILVKVSGITYRSTEKHKAKVGQFYFYNNASYVTVDLFDFVYGNFEIIGSNNNHNVISNNRIHALSPTGVDFGAPAKGNIVENNEIYNVGHGVHTSGGTVGTIIRGNIIHDCGPTDTAPTHGHGLAMVGGTGEKYLNNIIYNCAKVGIHPGSSRPSNGKIIGNLVYNCGASAIMLSGSGFFVGNNTFIGKNGSTTYVCYISGSGHTLKNNIGYRKDGIKYVVLLPRDATTDYNCWYDPNNPKCISRYFNPMTLAIYQTYGQGVHSISEDPKFINIANNNYRLQADSPCKGMGYSYEIQPIPEPEPGPEPQPEPEYVKKSVLIEALQSMMNKIKEV